MEEKVGVVKPKNLIKAISDGLLGFLLYKSRLRQYQVYSEKWLYEPIYMIGKMQGWEVYVEVVLKNEKNNKTKRGDKKRLDFLFLKGDKVLMVEVKYIKENKYIPSIINDKEKFLKMYNKIEGFYKNKYDKKLIKLSDSKLEKYILIVGRYDDKIKCKVLKNIDDNLSCYYHSNLKGSLKGYGIWWIEVKNCRNINQPKKLFQNPKNISDICNIEINTCK